MLGGSGALSGPARLTHGSGAGRFYAAGWAQVTVNPAESPAPWHGGYAAAGAAGLAAGATVAVWLGDTPGMEGAAPRQPPPPQPPTPLLMHEQA